MENLGSCKCPGTSRSREVLLLGKAAHTCWSYTSEGTEYEPPDKGGLRRARLRGRIWKEGKPSLG